MTVNGNLAVSDVLLVDYINTSEANEITVQDNMVIGSTTNQKSLWVNGNFNISGFYPHRPYVGLLVTSAGSISTNVGYIASEQITITIASSGAYSIAFPAHPNGANFLVHVDYKTGASSTALYIPTANNTSSSITVWLRSTTNSIHAGNFYVHTVP